MPVRIGKALIGTDLFHQQELRLQKYLLKHLLELVTQGPKDGSKVVQGDPNQNSPFLRAITQKISISDPKLVSQNALERQ